MEFKQTKSSRYDARLPRRPPPLPLVKDSRCGVSRIRSCPSKGFKSCMQSYPRQWDFAPTCEQQSCTSRCNPIAHITLANRFSVLAEPDGPPVEPKWTFDFVPNTTRNTRRRDRCDKKHRQIKAAVPKEDAIRSKPTSDRTISLHANSSKPASVPQKMDHTRYNSLMKDSTEVLKEGTRNYCAPQFRPGALPIPSTALATPLGATTFPIEPEPCLSLVNTPTLHLESEGMKRRESRFFPPSCPPVSSDSILSRTDISLTQQSMPSSEFHLPLTRETSRTFPEPPLPPDCLIKQKHTRAWVEPSDGITIFKTLRPVTAPIASACKPVNIPRHCPSSVVPKDAPKQCSVVRPSNKQESTFGLSSPEIWQEMENFLATGHRNPCWCSRHIDLMSSSKAIEIPQLLPEHEEQTFCKSDAFKGATLDTRSIMDIGLNASIESLSLSSSTSSYESQSEFEDLYDEMDQIGQEENDWAATIEDDQSSILSTSINSTPPPLVAPIQNSTDMESVPGTEEGYFSSYKSSPAFSSVESFELLEEQNCALCSKCVCACIGVNTGAVEWPTPHETACIDRSSIQDVKSDAAQNLK